MKAARQQPMYVFLLVLTISSTIGLQAWRTLFNNFAVEVAAMNGDHIGWIQSIREVPGFLSLLAVYIILVVREHRLSALSIMILGIGVAATGMFPSFYGLIITTLIMSFGFHYYETTNQSLTLQYFDAATSPWVFGKQRSYAAAANIVIGLAIYFLTPVFAYREMYIMVGILVAAAGVWGIRRHPENPRLPRQRRKMILRKRYSLFYLLTFLAGARRQIFMAFAVFLLVKRFGYSVREITILFVINNAVNYFLSPLIGKAIIRFGERKVLTLEYASLLFIFVAYAVVDSRMVAALLYILDHIFFNFAIAIRTYFQKIGDVKDIAPSMAVGFTINHIAAVFFPAIGGLFWMVDYRVPFLFGAFLSTLSLAAVQFIRIPDRKG